MNKGFTITRSIFSSLFLTTFLLLFGVSDSWATTYYPSSAGGNWSAGASWSTASCGGATCTCSPGLSTDIVNLTCAKTIILTTSPTTGAITISGGTLTIPSGYTLTCSSLSMTSGTLTVNGTLNVGNASTGSFSITGGTFSGTGTVGLTGTTQNLACNQSFYNLNIAGSGNKTMTSSIAVTNLLTLTANDLVIGAYTLTIGNGINGQGITRTSGYITTSTTSSLSFGGGTYNYTLGTYLSNTWPVTLTNFTMTNDLATITLGTSQSLTVSGTFDLSAGGNFKIGANTLTLNGVVNMSGTCFCDQITGGSTSNLTLGGSGAASMYFDQTTTTAGGTNTIQNFTISAARAFTMLDNLRIGGTLSTVSGSTIGIANSTSLNQLTIDGSFSGTNAGTFIGNATYAIMVINGTGALGANLTFSSVLSLSGLQINRTSSGSVVLGSNLTLNGGNLTMTAGTLDINNKTLALGTGSSIASETSTNRIFCSTCTATTGEITSSGNTLAASTAYTNIRGLGVDITTGTTAPGSTTINRFFGAQSGSALTNSILRTYAITPATNTGLNATVNINYWTSELNSLTEANLLLFSAPLATTTWASIGGTVNTSTHAISLSGVNQFAQLTVGVGAACTNPTLASTAQASVVCSGTVATINLTGLLSNAAQTVTYSFNGSGNQTASFTSSGTTGSFNTYRTLTTSDNSQVLTISQIVAGSCTTSSFTTGTNTVTLSVVAQPTVTLAIDNSTVCTGGTATLAATPGGGTGSPTYTWQSTTSLSPPTGMSTDGGQTASTLVPSTTSASGPTAYQVLVTYNGTGCNASAYTTNYPTLTVEAQPTSGTLTPTPAAGTVCNGDIVSATATSGSNGAGTITDYLQYRFDGGSWITYTSGTGLNTSGHTSVNIQTYRTANGSNCNTSTANTVSWTVSSTADTWNGSASNDWFTAGNWSCGFVPTSTTNVLIPTGLTNPYPQIAGIVGDTAYTQTLTVQSGASLDILGVNGVNLEVFGDLDNSGTITENAPGKIYAMGSGVQNVTGNNKFTNFIVDNSVGVTIASGLGNALNISGTLTLQSGILTTNNNLAITSDINGAGLVDDFSSGNHGSISGNLTIQRYVVNPTPSHTTGISYYFIGSPVNGATISQWNNEFANTAINGAANDSYVIPTTSCSDVNLADNSPYGGLFEYNESVVTTCNQSGWETMFSGTIPTGQGFAGQAPNGTALALTGTYNTGSILSPTLTVTATNITETPGFGWNLVANPYASPIHWLSVASANNNLSGTVYTYIASGATAGTYNPVNELTYESNGLDQVGSSEAFWVEATTNNSTISFTNSMRSNGSNAFLRTAQSWDQLLSLNVSGNGYNDALKIAFGSKFTNGFDAGYDAHKLLGRSVQPNVYVTDSMAKYCIYAIPAVTQNERDVPVSFTAGTSGEFSFTADLNGFDPTALVFLEDMKTHTVQNLMANATYSFAADVNDDPGRFVLHFMPVAMVNITPADCNGRNGLLEANMGQYSLAGQPVLWSTYTLKASNNVIVAFGGLTDNSLSVANLPDGIYTLQLTINDYTVDKQIEVVNKQQVIAAFTTPMLVAAIGDSVVFNDISTGATNYNWQFGDGTTSDLENPTHIYSTEGTYQVALTASNPDCSGNDEKTIRVESIATGINTTKDASAVITGYENEVNIEFNNFTASDEVTVNIYDITGRKVIASQQIATANNRQVIHVSDVVSGYYFVVLTGQNYEKAGKVFLSAH